MSRVSTNLKVQPTTNHIVSKSGNQKQKANENNLQADVLGGHIASPWVRLHHKSEPTSHHLHRPQPDQWCHIREGVQIPMPTDKVLAAMTSEFYQRVEGQGVGPVTAVWRDKVFAWARSLKKRLFGDNGQVTGLWSKAAKKFKKRLKYLPKKELAVIMREITTGFSHPFRRKPSANIFVKRNHPNLAQRPHAVYNALHTQLHEGSVRPWDWRSRGHPKGIFSLRWVEKSGTDEVRLTLNGRPLNSAFRKEDVTIVLETHADLRERYMPGMMFMGLDLHHGFFNASYDDDATKWVCFRISEAELAPADVATLRKRYPDAWRGEHIYFCSKGLVMGLSPSCRQLTKVVDALMVHWRRCPVKAVVWDMTNYIDDSMAMAQGAFRGAVRLSLRLLAEYVCLGFSPNLNSKSQIVPTTFYCHIGILISSSRMRFSLPQRRVDKIEAALRDLADIVITPQGGWVNGPVCAKKVAKVIGLLWSASIVCHRSVAIMTRGLIRTLAVMLRTPELRGVDDPKRLSYILKRVWGGTVMWTYEAHQDLLFWLQVHFGALSSPISHDARSKDISTWVINPSTGSIASDVRVFAVDTSAKASGGGEFLRDGKLWRVRNKMVVQLTDEEVLESSAYRELLGTDRVDLAVIPRTCLKAVVGMDAMASVQCLLNGSKVEALQRVVRRIFLRQLAHNRILFPTWVGRSEDILRICDDFSRLVDFHKFAMPAGTFWRANAIAIKVWGRGFQLDLCADMHNVQPGDSVVKLPFFSRWCSPHSSGVDMFSQDWRATVNWCNPPFTVIPRVISLLRDQRATAAVVMPLGADKWWSSLINDKLPVVQRVMRLQASDVWQKKVLPRRARRRQHSPHAKMAIVFFDFGRRPPSTTFSSTTPSAEHLHRHLPQPRLPHQPASSNKFLQLHRHSGGSGWGGEKRESEVPNA